jgi:hypothetical protein
VGAFFGSVPLGLPGWVLVLAAAAAGTALSPAVNGVLPAAIPLVRGIARPGTAGPTPVASVA